MTFQLWLPFFLANLATSLTPGMGALAVINAGLSRGPNAAWQVVAGLQAALLIQLGLVALGTSWLQQHPLAFRALQWGGGLYLAWLGAAQVWAAWRPSPDSTLHASSSDMGQTPFWRGLWVNLSNPKALVFMFALVPQFIQPNAQLAPQYALIGFTTVVTDTAVMGSYGMLAARLSAWLDNPRASRWRNGIFGSLFLLLALGLLFTDFTLARP